MFPKTVGFPAFLLLETMPLHPNTELFATRIRTEPTHYELRQLKLHTEAYKASILKPMAFL